MPLNSTQLINKYQQSLSCCLTSTSNTIDYLFGSIGSELTGGTNSSATYEQLITCASSANTSNGNVVFSTDYNIPLKFDSSSCSWKTFDDSRIIAKKIVTPYGIGLNNICTLTSANSTQQCIPLLYTCVSDWKCVWPQMTQSYCNNVFATKRDGSLWAWGCFYRQLPASPQGGLDQCLITPFKISECVRNICDIHFPCNYTSATVAITEAGEVFTWGCNNNTSRGYGTTTIIAGFTKLMEPAGSYVWSKISLGAEAGYAIRNNGELWGWGFNSYGQLGDNSTINRCSPVTVAGGGTTWCDIAGAYASAAAVKTDGTLWTWGRNYAGQLGVGCTNVNFQTCSPGTTIGSQGDWCHVAAQVHQGFTRYSAIQLDGTLWTWGCNACGLLGRGFDNATCSCQVSPVTVIGGGTTWCKSFHGHSASFAVKTDGTLWAWGGNAYTQLGIGCCDTAFIATSPRQITAHAGCWDSVNPGYATHFAFTYKEIL